MAESSYYAPQQQARRLVLQGLYAREVGETTDEQVGQSIFGNDEVTEKSREYSQALYAAVNENTAWADENIRRLAENWDLERIAVIDRIIMRIAMTELKTMPDVPVKVVLNEAIELAKLYSTGESSRFINGILDAFVKNSPECSGV